MIFLRKIVPGAADDSYGIEVAKLAGIPDPVITRAREILAELESEGVVSGARGGKGAGRSGQHDGSDLPAGGCRSQRHFRGDPDPH